MSAISEPLIKAYTEHYGTTPKYLVRAPGRVNLIGEHTDYNDGFVLPLAIDRAVWIALSPSEERRVSGLLLDFDGTLDIDLANIEKAEASPTEYIKGVAWALQQAGHDLQGWTGVIRGDVPIGAGLSSSAALEMASARAFATVSGFDWNPIAMAKIGQQAENQWVGVSTGIMDQTISAGGQADHALLIDCRSLDTQAAPLPEGTSVVVLDTSTRRGLVGSAYNERRAQCEAAAKFFGVDKLRDVTVEEFEAKSGGLDNVTRRRARHVITENDRTLKARDAMLRGDPDVLGELMVASHLSLRYDFEVSTDALNDIVTCARQHPGCYGARMTGAGFGGCGVALVRTDAVEDFNATIKSCYTAATELEPQIYVCQASDGATVTQIE